MYAAICVRLCVCVRMCICLSTWRCSSRRTTCRALERALKQPPSPSRSLRPRLALPFPFSRRRASSLCRLFNYILAKGSSIEKSSAEKVRTQGNKNEVVGGSLRRERSLLSKVPLLVIDMCLMSALLFTFTERERRRELGAGGLVAVARGNSIGS